MNYPTWPKALAGAVCVASFALAIIIRRMTRPPKK